MKASTAYPDLNNPAEMEAHIRANVARVIQAEAEARAYYAQFDYCPDCDRGYCPSCNNTNPRSVWGGDDDCTRCYGDGFCPTCKGEGYIIPAPEPV
jgi:hypothetical protein